MRNDIDRMYSALIEKGFIDNNLKMMCSRKQPYILARIAITYCLAQTYMETGAYKKIGEVLADYFGRSKPFDRTAVYHTVKTGSFALLTPYGQNKDIAKMIDAIAEIKPIGINSRQITSPIQTPVYCV